MDQRQAAEEIGKIIRALPKEITDKFADASDAFLDHLEKEGVDPILAGVAVSAYMRSTADRMAEVMAVLAKGLLAGKSLDDVKSELGGDEEE